MSFFGCLTFRILLTILWQETEGKTDTSNLSDLLAPQLRLQITLRIPEDEHFMASELPALLNSAIDFLVSQQAPFRLFYNFTQGKPWSLVTRSPRFTQHLAVWLVFFSVQRKTEVLDLDKVLQSCSLGTKFGLSTAVHRDFIQLIVDDSAVAETWIGACGFNIPRAYVPLYFVMMYWSGTYFRSVDALLLRETCGCDGDSNFTSLENFIPKLKEPNGMTRILKQIASEKRDFRGRKVNVSPIEDLLDRWESGPKHFFSPFSFRAAHKDSESALASVFDSFISQHNFTVDFVSWQEGLNLDTNQAVVRMMSSMGCSQPLDHCYAYPMSLFRFQHYKTLVFSRSIQPEPFSLLSLKAPFSDRLAVLMLLGTSFCMAIVLTAVGSKYRDIGAISLSIFSGLVGKPLAISNPTSAQCYSFWLLFAGVVSVTYTNILQSHVVVPGVRYNGLSFEDMAERNYSFESTFWGWMRNVMSYNAVTSLSRREKILSERVSGRGSHLVRGFSDEFIRYYSEAAKRALVQSDYETQRYASLSKVTDWDVVIGKEEFFSLPLWWNFVRVERASLLAASVESLKESGILHYFLQLSDLKMRNMIAATSIKTAMNSTYASVAIPTADYESSCASLSDALVTECFVLYMYGVVTAFVVFVAEQLTRARMKVGCTHKRNYVN